MCRFANCTYATEMRRFLASENQPLKQKLCVYVSFALYSCCHHRHRLWRSVVFFFIPAFCSFHPMSREWTHTLTHSHIKHRLSCIYFILFFNFNFHSLCTRSRVKKPPPIYRLCHCAKCVHHNTEPCIQKYTKVILNLQCKRLHSQRIVSFFIFFSLWKIKNITTLYNEIGVAAT